MKLTSYFNEKNNYIENDFQNPLIELSSFARFGKIDTSDGHKFFSDQRDTNPVFVWDILMVESVFKVKAFEFKKFYKKQFNIIRLQDPGAIYWIHKNFPELKIQLILETGHHNLDSIRKWCQYLGEKVERVILSPELPKDILKLYCEKLSVPIEILGLGRLLLFYTPRELLSPYLDKRDQWTEVSGRSEESPHVGFPIIQNRHGTFMFNVKDLGLLEVIDELNDMGISYFRVDLRFLNNHSLLKKINMLINDFSKEMALEIKAQYPQELIRGYYSKNRSDVIFKKLKNQKTLRDDSKYIGEVIEVAKPKHLALLIKSRSLTLSLLDEIKVLTTEGKEINAKVYKMFNSSLEPLTTAKNGDLVFINHIRGVTTKSIIEMIKSS